MAESPVKIVQPRRLVDGRGWFSETYKEKDFSTLSGGARFVQDNHSFSRSAGTLRGVHFQVPPHAQDKLVRCVRGRIFDIAVDLRSGSPTFGQWVGSELSAENGKQLFIPVGFGHAFLTLEPDTEVFYKVTDYYAPECDRGIRWDDADIAIDWKLGTNLPRLSPKDGKLPFLRDFVTPFIYNDKPLRSLEG